ncbi:Rsd/AlgQ family anti-sigma factor [Veronia pacifica]|uniref:Anti-sigma factor n=1 Tax=Veronia pacifica TaxID=1080227 RepID=A0A1C3ECR7_9GAMM|nr:Rsd/AlgQ family anti-sigma factor [Veronia pacifica]ODA31015.1 anti-sigma factor [Veronia pacifica]
MLNKFEQLQQQWGGYSDIIDYWLTLRQELLVEYCKLAGLSAKNNTALPTQDELNRFCENLVDYISAGHFKIYDMVMERWKENSFSSNEEINQLYQHIVDTTEPLLDFNDKYSKVNMEEVEDDIAKFDSHISKVGELMELRFEVEDALIAIIAESLAASPKTKA